MQALSTVLLVVMILSALTMVGLILIQHGKGADMGASFGSGASGSLFGATGSANFLSRSTAVAATIFFVSTLALAYMGSHRDGGIGSGPSAGEQLLERAAVPSAPASAAVLPGASIAPQAAPSAAASGASN